VSELVRSSLACLVGLAVAASSDVLHAAPRRPAEIEKTDVPAGAVPEAASTAPDDVRMLIRRAELRRAVGDDAGAITLLVDALERTLDARLEPRTQAEIRLTLLAIHEELHHREIADRIRAGLLRERDLLQLTPKEIEQLRRGDVHAEPAAAQPVSPVAQPAVVVGDRGTSSVVEEKVIESEVFSDRKMISSGIGLTTIGLGFGLGGAVLLIYARSTERSLDEYEIPEQEDERKRAISDGNAENGAGIAFVAIGGVLVLAGVTLIAVGYGRKRARLGKGRHHKSAHIVPSVSGIGVRF
jgi:hypothetical protein